MREPAGWDIDWGLQRQGRSSSSVLCLRIQFIEYSRIGYGISGYTLMF